MRQLRDYGLRDWLVADPFRHRIRRLRNIAIQSIYKSRRTSRQDELIAALRPQVEGKVVTFTVAFNMVRTLEWLADGFARLASETVLIVCDNSPSAASRSKIEAVCAARAIPYVPLPRPPLQFLLNTNPALSHGVALTWIFYNLVRPLKPKVFAFIDHDLIPLTPFDFRELVKNQPVYGMMRGRPTSGPWNLWAGYCVYDFDVIGHHLLDFSHDNPLKLDTGGQNWTRLYRHLDPDPMRFARSELIELKVSDAFPTGKFLLVDGWLHVGGITYRPDSADRLKLVEEVLGKLATGSRSLNEFVLARSEYVKGGYNSLPILNR